MRNINNVTSRTMDVYRQDLERLKTLEHVETNPSTLKDLENLQKILFETSEQADSYTKHIIKLLNLTRSYHINRIDNHKNLACDSLQRNQRLEYASRQLLTTRAAYTEVINVLTKNLQNNAQN